MLGAEDLARQPRNRLQLAHRVLVLGPHVRARQVRARGHGARVAFAVLLLGPSARRLEDGPGLRTTGTLVCDPEVVQREQVAFVADQGGVEDIPNCFDIIVAIFCAAYLDQSSAKIEPKRWRVGRVAEALDLFLQLSDQLIALPCAQRLMLAEAAKMLATEEQALQLRYLQTLKEISNERTNTIVFPMPIEFVEPILHLVKKKES